VAENNRDDFELGCSAPIDMKMNRARTLIATLALGGILHLSLATAGTGDEPPASNAKFDLKRTEIKQFIQRIVLKDGIPRSWLTHLMRAARTRPELMVAMETAPEKTLTWWEYRNRFVTAQRIAEGTKFLQEKKDLLYPVSTESGIPPEYLVAILGIETNYGRSTGSYREIDTLMTLAFDYPTRQDFFRDELRQFILLSREAKLPPLEVRGSYGGALGAPQFMPSSYRRFAVGASHTSVPDLWTDWAAILSSMVNFLNAHGWILGGAVLTNVTLSPDSIASPGTALALDETVGDLLEKGVHFNEEYPDSTTALLLGLQLEDSVCYAVAFKNFYVITRYNPRINYALAAWDLAREIRAASDSASPN
jgi:membrane-bound lytic murein transglycosylase B